MRKITFNLGIIGALLVTYSCQKKSIIHENAEDLSNSTSSNSTITSKQKPGWGICCVWNGVDACVSPAVNCFDEVVVKPKYTEVAKALQNFDSAISNGPKEIASFFLSNDAKILFPDLICFCDSNPFNEYVSKLTSGNYYITTTQKGNKFYYLVKPNGTNAVDFVLTIKKEGLGNN